MRTLFINARLLTMENGPIFEDNNLLIEDSNIVYIGKEKPKADKVIDCNQLVLMPGLKNAHTHSAMIFMRGKVPNLPLMEWLQEVYKYEATLTPELVKQYTKEIIPEYFAGGTTGIFDMYFFAYAISEAAVETGMRLSNLFMVENDPERIAMFNREFEKYSDKESIVRPVVGLHAEYTIGDGIEAVKSLKDKHKSPMFTHISESYDEVKGSIERRGMTPTAWYEANNLFEFGGGGYHCCWLTDEDIEIFKKHDLIAVTCMGSNIQLRDGVAPLDRFFKEGIRIAIGTDGPISNASISLWREMHLIKAYYPSLPDFEILKMATVHGAYAMGFPNCSTLKIGNKADMILVDASSIEDLVTKTQDNDVKKVFVNGRLVFER